MPLGFEEIRYFLIRMWRWRWLALAGAWAIFLVGAGVVVMIPDRYESTARIYVDTESLLKPLLKGITVEGNIDERVRVMQRTLLSTPNLEQVARMIDLDLEVTTPGEKEGLLREMEARARVRSEGQELFAVSYADTDPRLARDIVQALLTIFIESNLGTNRADMAGAQTFIARQIASYERQLRDSERRIADFRAQHFDVVGQTNFSTRVDNVRRELAQGRLDYEERVVTRDQIQKQLEATPKLLSFESSPQVVVGDQMPLSTRGRIQQLRANLDSLLMRYTDAHPDVVATRRQIEVLTARLEDAEGGDAESGGFAVSEMPNPVYDEMRVRLFDAEAAVELARRRVIQAQDRMDRLSAMAQEAPTIEAQLADLTRDYEVLRGKYNELLDRRESARIAQAMDVGTDKVEFRIIEPPRVPIQPTGPNRSLYLAMVLAVAVGAGLGVAYLRSQLDDSFLRAEELQRTFQRPVLGTVTRLLSTEQQTRQSRLNYGFAAAALGIVVVAGVVSWALPYLAPLRTFFASFSGAVFM